MPFYGSRLKASTLPANEAVSLESLCEESRNPHLLSAPKLVARLVREYGAKWVLDTLNEKNFPDAGARTTLNQRDLEDRLYHLFGVVLEMMVASEFARESVYSLFIIKHMLMKAMPLVLLIQDKLGQERAHDLNTLLWEIHRAICSIEGPGKALELDSIEGFILWGEAALKLARTYFVPQGANEFAKTDYFDCLSLAQNKFNKALALIEKTRKRIPESQWETLRIPIAHARAGNGYVYLLKARASHDETAHRTFLGEAYINLKKAEDIAPSINSTYNIACVCSLSGRYDEAQAWLDLASQEGALPKPVFMKFDSDLAGCHTETWFKKFISAPTTGSGTRIQDPIDRSVVLRTQTPILKLIAKEEPKASEPKKEIEKVNSKPGPNAPLKYSEDEALNNAITFDEDLNRLQASLMREGFSVTSAMGMVLEMGKAKHQKMEEDKTVKENRLRLNERLKAAGLREKRQIAGDGNCQFAAIADQLFDNVSYADYVREEAVKWLRANKDWELPNGAVPGTSHMCLDDQSWDALCDELSRRGIWGNHLTLVAMAEKFGLKIRVVSSVKGDNYITEVNPSKVKTTKTGWLSHYAEYHYGSLCAAEQ